MYSVAGRRLMNLVLAGKRPTLATHIALGLNTVYDASIDGATTPSTHNYINSPYIVEYVPIKNIGIVSTETTSNADEIVFSGDADISKQYVANNMALVNSPSGDIPDMYVIAGVGQPVWIDTQTPSAPITPLLPDARFSNDGVIQITDTAIYNAPIVLSGVDPKSIIAMPFFVTSPAIPTGCTVTISLSYTLDGVSDTVTYQGNITSSVVNSQTQYKFSHDNVWNYVVNLGTAGRLAPFLFQKRLETDTKVGQLLNSKTVINQLKVQVNNGYTIQFGDIVMAPSIDDAFTLTNISHRRLSSILYKTEDEAYINAEYRIRGIV